MKFIKDINGSLINLDHVVQVFIDDRGKDYTKQFEILAQHFSYSKCYVLAQFEFEDMADNFLNNLFNSLCKK